MRVSTPPIPDPSLSPPVKPSSRPGTGYGGLVGSRMKYLLAQVRQMPVAREARVPVFMAHTVEGVEPCRRTAAEAAAATVRQLNSTLEDTTRLKARVPKVAFNVLHCSSQSNTRLDSSSPMNSHRPVFRQEITASTP